MRVAWFSALQDSIRFSPSAYCTSIIVPELRKKGIIVEVYSDLISSLHHGIQTDHYLNAQKCHEKNPYDLFFHQVEDGQHAHFLRSAVGLYPGVTYFHDLYLSDLGPDPLTNSPWGFVAEVMHDSKDSQLIEWPDRLKEFPRKGPFPEREFALSWGAIFSNIRMCTDAKNKDSSKLLATLSYPIAIPAELNQKSSIIALYGSPFIEDRIHKIIPALKKLSQHKIIWAVAPKHYQIAKDRLKEFSAEYIQLIQVTRLEEWAEVVSTASVCLHLHHSVYGNLSPFIETSLVSGAHVLITEGIDESQFPTDVVFTIPAGETESQMIYETVKTVLQNPKMTPHILGKEYVVMNNNLETVVGDFLALFKQSKANQENLKLRWQDVQTSARNALFAEVKKYQKDSVFADPFSSIYKELEWQ